MGKHQALDAGRLKMLTLQILLCVAVLCGIWFLLLSVAPEQECQMTNIHKEERAVPNLPMHSKRLFSHCDPWQYGNFSEVSHPHSGIIASLDPQQPINCPSNSRANDSDDEDDSNSNEFEYSLLDSVLFKHSHEITPNEVRVNGLFLYFVQFLVQDLVTYRSSPHETFTFQGTACSANVTHLCGKHDLPCNWQTPVIDAGMIYGHKDSDRLRAFEHGMLKVSYPETGPCAGSHHVFSHDDHANHRYRLCSLPPTKRATILSGEEVTIFECGDYNQCNENLGVLSLTILFWREHNYWAGLLQTHHPQWSDEQLFHEAKERVIAEIQHITVRYVLPLLLGSMFDGSHNNDRTLVPSPFGCYNSDVDTKVSEEFVVAMRLDSFFPKELHLRNGTSPFGSVLSLPIDDSARRKRENVHLFTKNKHPLDVVLSGLIHNPAERRDLQIVKPLNHHCTDDDDDDNDDGYHSYSSGLAWFSNHSLENLLYSSRVSQHVLLDRTNGVASYSSAFWKLYSTKLQSWSDFVDDPHQVSRLEQLYGPQGWNNLDLWVGILAEKPVANSLFGKVGSRIILDQFIRSISGDQRFYRWNSALRQFMSLLYAESFSEIIERNSHAQLPREWRTYPAEIFSAGWL